VVTVTAGTLTGSECCLDFKGCETSALGI